MKFSKNLIAQLLSLFFLAFTFSGFEVVPDELANRIVDGLSNGQFYTLGLYLLTNVVNIAWHWYLQLKVDKSKFWLFLKSVNFWIAAGNIVVYIVLVTTGIEISTEAMGDFIALLFNGDYYTAASLFMAQILIPIIKAIVNKKVKELPIG